MSYCCLDGRRVLGEIIDERHRQDRKWGQQNHHMYKWLSILGEEVGEVNKAVLENTDVNNVRSELVQVAAVAMAAIESFDRYGVVGKEEEGKP